MSTIADFFGCCGKELKEKQVTVTIQERRRAHSENTARTAKIKRSVGKSPKIDERQKPSGNHTYLSLTCCSKSSKVMEKRSKEVDSSSSFEHSFQGRQQLNRSLTPSKDSNNQSNFLTSGEKITKFINYNRYCNSQIPNPNLQRREDLQNFNLNTDIQMPVIKTSTPRLLLDRRFRKAREHEGISIVTSQQEDKRSSSITFHRKKQQVHTILQPIEERLSMPSCSQSQIHDFNPSPSYPLLARLNQPGHKFPQSSPLSQKYRSCTFDKDMNHTCSGLAMVRSENIQSFEEKLSHQHRELIGNKVRIDIEIYQNQLKSLIDEQKVLRQQSLFSKHMFKERVDRLQETKKDLMEKMERYQNSLKQMVKLAKGRGEESGKDLRQSRQESRY